MSAQTPEELFRIYNVSRESRFRLQTYVNLLLTWQKAVNLIGPSTVPLIWSRHICDALQLLPLLPPNCETITDLGSGAGIPGLVVALAADIEVHLYESNAKKCAFLREVVRKTGVRASVQCVRLEEIELLGAVPAVQCVVSRALARLPLLLELGEPFLRSGAIGLFHKGRDVALELTEATKYWRFQSLQHASACDSQGVVLEVREVSRV